jgi:hypothetical protein
VWIVPCPLADTPFAQGEEVVATSRQMLGGVHQDWRPQPT